MSLFLCKSNSLQCMYSVSPSPPQKDLTSLYQTVCWTQTDKKLLLLWMICPARWPHLLPWVSNWLRLNTKLLSVDERIDSVENKVQYIDMEELKTKRRILSPKIAVRLKMKAHFILLTRMSGPVFLFCAPFVGEQIREMVRFFMNNGGTETESLERSHY